MSKSHTWFGTRNDAELIIAWLRNAGAHLPEEDLPEGKWTADGSEIVLHFPSFGPVEFWPDNIPLPERGDYSVSAKRMILARIAQQEHPGLPQINVGRSAVVGLQLPEWRDNRYWIAGHVWFPTSRLKEVFPQLNRVCSRFERFLKSYSVVYDNTKGQNTSEFDYQICSSGIVHRIFALPEAYELLKHGEFMVDYLVSPRCYADFRRRLQLSGYEQ